MNHVSFPQDDSITFNDPVIQNINEGDSYNSPPPEESYGSPSSEFYSPPTEEADESEYYGSPQSEVLTYPGEYEYIPEQSLDSFSIFASFNTNIGSDPGPGHDTQADNDIQDTGPGPGVQTPNDSVHLNFPQPGDDDAPNIPQVPSSDTPDQANPEQYLNTEPGVVISVLDNPPYYSEAVDNFLEKMRDESNFVFDLTDRE